MSSFLDKIDIRNPKHYLIIFFIFIVLVSFYPLLSNNVDYCEKLFLGTWLSSLTILMFIFSLLLNKYHTYAHSLFWFFYMISIFFISSFEGKVLLLVLSLSIIGSWSYFKSLGKSKCPMANLYDRSKCNKIYNRVGNMMNNVIYLYAIIIVFDLLT